MDCLLVWSALLESWSGKSLEALDEKRRIVCLIVYWTLQHEKISAVIVLPSTVRLKLLVLLPAWLLATQLYRPSSERATSGSWSRVSCPSSSRFLCKDSGCPSFIQVSVGSGNPRASQVKVTKDPWTTVTGSTGSTRSTPGGTAYQEHVPNKPFQIRICFVLSLEKSCR